MTNNLNLVRATVGITFLRTLKDAAGRTRAVATVFQPSRNVSLALHITNPDIVQTLLRGGKTNLWTIVVDKSQKDHKEIIQVRATTTPFVRPVTEQAQKDPLPAP